MQNSLVLLLFGIGIFVTKSSNWKFHTKSFKLPVSELLEGFQLVIKVYWRVLG